MKIVLALLMTCFMTVSFAKDNLIPLDVFAKKQAFTNMKISPTGKYLAFTYEDGDQVKLAIMDRESKKITASFDNGENRHVTNFEWLNDERVGMTVQTIMGWLDGTNSKPEWLAANADGSERFIIWRSSRGSWPTMISKLPDEPKHVLATVRNYRDKGNVKVFKINIYREDNDYLGGEPEAAAHMKPGIVGFQTDLKDDVRFAIGYDVGELEFEDIDDTLTLFYKSQDDAWKELKLKSQRAKRPMVNFIGMSTDNNKAYFISNHDQAESDSMGLFEFDLKNQKINFIYRHPDVDIQGGITGTDGQLIGVYLEPGYPEIHYIDNDANKQEIALRKALAASFKGSNVSLTSVTDDDMKFVVYVRSDRNPGDFYLFDRANNKLAYLASTKPEVDPKLMARVEPFTYLARDGLKVYGLLTIPNNVEEKDLPLVVYPHGGPYGVGDRWGWDRRAQMMASRGYLVMQVNFRGSGGYGEDFEEAGYQEWGARMQDDITDATLWAIKTGIADADRICIHGVSYGGYASMNAVVKEPDLYKCSIPDAGVYEMALQWKKADSFKGPRGAERRESYMKQCIGGYDFVEERSPVYHVEKLKAALFIVHGAADVRVPIDNAYILEEKLKEAGKPYITMYKEEEGHGFQVVENRIELYGEILDFLDKHIGSKAKKVTQN
jgi:dipeptidyl aminopeptidase/acylaminoacyl peptidase